MRAHSQCLVNACISGAMETLCTAFLPLRLDGTFKTFCRPQHSVQVKVCEVYFPVLDSVLAIMLWKLSTVQRVTETPSTSSFFLFAKNGSDCLPSAWTKTLPIAFI